MQMGSKFLKNFVIHMGPYVKALIRIESRSQSSTSLLGRPLTTPAHHITAFLF